MGNLHVILDSTACLPENFQDDHLHIISLTVRLGDKEWLEDQLPVNEMFQRIEAEGLHPSTSQPSTGAFLELYQSLLEKTDEVIVITLSGSLSGTVQGARMAADLLRQERPGNWNIRVIDSGTTAGVMVELAQRALEMSRQGVSAEDIAKQLEDRVAATHTLFVPSTLEYLRKGGRIGGAAALLGGLLQIRPVLYLVQGRVAVLDKVRTRKRSVDRMVEEVRQHSRMEYILVGATGKEPTSEAEALIAELRELFPSVPVNFCAVGPVLGAHLGPNLLGILFQEKITG